MNTEYNKQYYIDNKEQILKKHAQYRLIHKKELAKHQKQWLKKTGYSKKYYSTHKKEIREQHRQYCNLKRKTDIKFNLNDRITTLIYLSLHGSKVGYHWENLVGYVLDDLIKRLNKTMPEGYTWNDYLDGKLHIDHIVPVSVFNYTKPEHTDFKRCWALSNLQLLPAKENLKKSNKLDKPFQPALAL
mgnify:CR=1 FL=1